MNDELPRVEVGHRQLNLGFQVGNRLVNSLKGAQTNFLKLKFLLPELDLQLQPAPISRLLLLVSHLDHIPQFLVICLRRFQFGLRGELGRVDFGTFTSTSSTIFKHGLLAIRMLSSENVASSSALQLSATPLLQKTSKDSFRAYILKLSDLYAHINPP
ncbi:hypothetical protein AAHE18_08G007100 [Arachis hypogaea]